MVTPHLIDLADVDRSQAGVVGHKAANLGALLRMGGVRVPPGFCVTTAAFGRLDGPLEAEIAAEVDGYGPGVAFAVRSSGTAEDLPVASFAGQHESYLGVVGTPAVLEAIRGCWSSLSTDRAVAYRRGVGVADGDAGAMAVLVQRMVAAEASGVLFTADPVSGNRQVAVVEATRGLGDAFVGGRENADVYRVRAGSVVDRRSVADPVLSDERIGELVEIGRRIEAQFGRPQDVEWCLDADGFHIVQARPVTTLHPVPEAADDAPRVYVSVGHAQMMTDPMTPLGLAVWQLTSPAPMRVAGSRLFVDVTDRLASPDTRAATLEVMGRGDPLVRDALETVVASGFVPEVPAGDVIPGGPVPTGGAGQVPDLEPAIVAELIEQNRASVADLRRRMATCRGTDVLDLVRADLADRQSHLFDPRSSQAVMAGFQATWWLDDHLGEWLGEQNATDVLSQAAPNNVTAEMGLALLDVADVVRPHPAVGEALRSATDETLFSALDALPEAEEARAALRGFLERYGMRCVGEIDIARPRWSERPTALVPSILANVEHFEAGERRRRVEAGTRAAQEAEERLLRRLRQLPGGEEKASLTAGAIEQLRAFIGYREYPKYGLVCRYAIYKEALLAEAEALVGRGALAAVDDVFFLTFDELEGAIGRGAVDPHLVARRRQEHRAAASLRPPRVLTSEGEGFDGVHRRDDVPDGALAGLATSGGTVEGRARVVHDMAGADLEPGDILVTTHTDPSWTPVFVTIAGLVTEVGGIMTHGAVIAREYGLAAVVGVERATERIADGQRIRVHGRSGYVELLPDDPAA